MPSQTTDPRHSTKPPLRLDGTWTDGSCRRMALPRGIRPGPQRSGWIGPRPCVLDGWVLPTQVTASRHSTWATEVRGEWVWAHMGWWWMAVSCRRKPLPHGIRPRRPGAWMDVSGHAGRWILFFFSSCQRRPLPHGIRHGPHGGLDELVWGPGKGAGRTGLADAGRCLTAFELGPTDMD